LAPLGVIATKTVCKQKKSPGAGEATQGQWPRQPPRCRGNPLVKCHGGGATPFGLADKNLMDFTGAISGILGSIGPTTPGTRGSAPLVFAPRDSGIEAQVNDAFASIPGLAYANDGVVFKNPTAVTDDGRGVWERGFVGERVQQADGVSLHATNDYAGGAVGADSLAGPDLRLGVFAGGGSSKLTVDANLENINTNTLFGRLYGRYAFTSLRAVISRLCAAWRREHKRQHTHHQQQPGAEWHRDGEREL
jgi:Autotransporter beta-domain